MGVWIETLNVHFRKIFIVVTPCVGVWIETIGTYLILRHDPVTPCVGVWIETRAHHHCTPKTAVTPCVGVWIETSISNNENVADMSHPAWVCGLKQTILRLLMLQRGHTLRGCVD